MIDKQIFIDWQNEMILVALKTLAVDLCGRIIGWLGIGW